MLSHGRLLPLLTGLVTTAACVGPQHRYAAAQEPRYARYELSIAEYPDAFSAWWKCFLDQDDERRQQCLEQTPGVRVTENTEASCGGAADTTRLCRAFPIDPPAAPEDDSDTGDDSEDGDSAAASAILETLGELLVTVITNVADDEESKGSKARRSKARRYQTKVPARAKRR